MQTRRLVKQDWFAFVGGLLGSVFGLMGSFVAVMNMVEILEKSVEKRMSNKRAVERYFESMEKMKGEFGNMKLKNNYSKVLPCSSTIVPPD